MSDGNSKLMDKGLDAINFAFQDAVYLSEEARECAQLMMAGAHRALKIPDSYAMEIYGIITEGKGAEITRTNRAGHGYVARVSSYSELAEFLRGELNGEIV